MRHEFQPGRLIAGLVLMLAGALFLADATGEADLPWYALPPIVGGGLALAAATGVATMLLRRRRRENGDRTGSDG
ncbi:hypothetical protein ACFV0R_23070 [Streptomyces sp. NPDC059578]|uniref:hypothetical protein n=1 Tax=unclassified Streptomyces TaxID=2593676 RepID=UPI003654EB6B